jgi:uncharacterized membrane protein YeiH
MYSGPETDEIIHILYLIAITAEAMTAAIVAGRRQMDWVGVFFLGCVTALGGGSIRDVLLDHHPLSWVEHPIYLIITGCAALAVIPIARFIHRLRQLFLFLDAVGLVVFTVIGCNVALSLGSPLIIVVTAGMLTGCMGGVLRDVICNDVPLVLKSELYVTVSVLTGLLYLGGLHLGLEHNVAAIPAMLFGLGLRMLALRFKWGMPRFIYTREWH